jgi:phosphatidylserine/phosphatidylglycerophosphate/cardiolipin synthase-like enzyme
MNPVLLLFSGVILFAPIALANAEMAVQACFSPQGKCATHIVREIENAKRELLVAVYAFTSDELAAALTKAKKRGLMVQVITDREFDSRNHNSKGKFLETQAISVRRLPGSKAANSTREPGLMHQKFAVFDRQIVFTGSYNWTQSADSINDENLLLFRDAGPLADEYRRIFLRLWERKS